MISTKAFTLMEMMVVVIILGIIAAFAIPNYSKAQSRAIEKNILNNIDLIRAANDLYKSSNEDYYEAQYVGINELNQNLNLNMVSSGETYGYYSNLLQESYTLTAIMNTANSNYVIVYYTNPVNPNSSNPCCIMGACPTVPACS